MIVSPGRASGSAVTNPVSLSAVTKSYRSQRDSTPVLDGVDLDLRRGEIACLVGASGSGKSTLVSLVAGLIQPDLGTVVIDGHDVSGLSDAERAHLRATRIGVVLQSGNLIPFLTAAENVALAMRFAGSARSAAWVRSRLLEVGVADRADHLPRRLSGGEAQRVAMAVALANDPAVLLADEAVGRLDSTTAGIVLDTIARACEERGLAVLLVTHDSDVAGRASRVVRLEDGRLRTER